MSVAIVIPALNEAETIGGVVRAVAVYGKPIVVDDGSTDHTSEVARMAGADVVRHAINQGYDAALNSGFARAIDHGASVVVTFDADGQHDPSLLDLFVAPLLGRTADLVIGIRPRAARFAEAAFNTYSRLRFGVPDILCGLKGYHIDLYRSHGCFDHHRMIGTELALSGLRSGARTVFVPVNTRERQGAPRLGRRLTANLLIMRALLFALMADLNGRTLENV